MVSFDLDGSGIDSYINFNVEIYVLSKVCNDKLFHQPKGKLTSGYNNEETPV